MGNDVNYMLKVTDAKMADVKKALEAAGIKVRGIVKLHEAPSSSEGAPASAPGSPSAKA